VHLLSSRAAAIHYADVLETLRRICRGLPGVTEDVKWGSDLCFSVGGKMFTVVNLEPPHQVAFKCTAESFGELIERDGIIPAPYMARNLWVQEQALGETLDRRELDDLVKTSYDLVVARLPKSKRPGAAAVARRSAARRGAHPRARSRRRAARRR
jgi:predicted DNA-binding protein (MmcQ/YjbR family)